MKEVFKYVADDGREFDHISECVKYEKLCEEIESIMSRLKCKIVTGKDFVQQSGPVFLGVQQDLVKIFERLRPDSIDEHTEWARDATVPAGFTLIGRYIDDAGPRPLNHAWHRIMCTDDKFREYEQPYWALEANKNE